LRNNNINKYRKTSIVGITSIGFDHTTVLGDTLEEIAWQKSGIMKPNSVTIVSNHQPKEIFKTLIERSVEKQVRQIFQLIFQFKFKSKVFIS
jgi:folylpolyglutamate synthase